jgi:putative transposase
MSKVYTVTVVDVVNEIILDASWGELKQKLSIMSEKAGVIFIEINPRGTSQECSICHYVSPMNRDKERFLCEACGYFCDADVQASINIRERGLKELGINLHKLPVVHGKVTPKEPVERPGKSPGLPGEPGEPPQYHQLSLWDLLESREGA